MASQASTNATKKIVEVRNLQNEAVQNAANQYVSQQTKDAYAKAQATANNPYKQFKPTANTQTAYNQWQDILAQRPEDYQSQYKGTIDNLLDQIVNRKKFSYDFNADPLYQNYKNQYMQAGKTAMKDTIAQASALTGGYGNTYAETAGSQSYQNYLKQLNDRIPELQRLAMEKYQMEGNELQNKYSAVGSQEDREFGQWNSKMNIWQNDRSYGLDAYKTLWDQDFRENEFNYRTANDDRNFNYQSYRDSKADDNTAYQNAYNAASDAFKSEYQMSRDSVADDQWNQQFAYQKERDKVADEQWAKEYALKAATAARAAAKAGKGAEEEKVDTFKQAREDYKERTQNDAYNYAYYIMNNTYGSDGENAAMGHLLRLASEGEISKEEANSISGELGMSFDKLSIPEIARYAGISQQEVMKMISEY
jgi:uncharacterized protein YidB (DUF937 family)